MIFKVLLSSGVSSGTLGHTMSVGLPESVDTSTFVIVPLPDHAMPEIWWKPEPASVMRARGA